MRKRIVPASGVLKDDEQRWIDFSNSAEVDITSEDPGFPIEAALKGDSTGGWRAGDPGKQTIRVRFDTPQQLTRIRLVFREEVQSRAQEFVLSWSGTDESQLHEIVRQQYNFSPPTTVEEVEDYRVELDLVKTLHLTIVPDCSSPSAFASLARLQLA